MDNTRCPQENEGKPIEERGKRPEKEQALNCPRCNSTNTKFCYYNNYSLTQPRYFCKTCRRYWTEGGSLRNVPVGGGARKNKRSSSSSSTKELPGLVPPPSLSQFSTQNPNIHDEQDPYLASTKLLTGMISSMRLDSFIPMSVPDVNTVYTSGFPMQGFKPTPNFSLDGVGSGYGGLNGAQETTGRLLFPFEDLKQGDSDPMFSLSSIEVDANGTLDVKAEDEGTGKSEKMTISNDKGHLRQEEIERMVGEERIDDEDEVEADDEEKVDTVVKEDYEEKLKEVEAVNPTITAVHQRSGGAPGGGATEEDDD